jgi:hypothetical protein
MILAHQRQDDGRNRLHRNLLNQEPMNELESLTCRRQEVRRRTIRALAALMARVIALMALAVLGFSGGSSHDSFHAAKQQLTHRCNAA